MADVPAGPERDGNVTHGICPECYIRVEAQLGLPVERYIESFPMPVMLVDSEVTVLAANAKALGFVQKTLERVQGFRGGEVFECAYSHLPEGCGRTLHCSGCAIRITVHDTHATGKTRNRVPASLRRESRQDDPPLRLLISTRKVGETVLLQVDDVLTAR